MKRLAQLFLVVSVSFLAGALWFRHQMPPFKQLREVYVVLMNRAPEDHPARPEQLIKFELPASADLSIERLTYLYDQLRDVAFSQNPQISVLNQGSMDPFEVGAKNTDIYEAKLAFGCASKIYLFHPKSQSARQNSLFIFHQGHHGMWTPNLHLIKALLHAEFHVAAFQMPFRGENACNFDFDDQRTGTINVKKHKNFQLVPMFHEQTGIHPLSFFLAPLQSFINFADQELGFDEYYMAGISGGGWTTTVYSAIDRRIRTAFSIAGDAPYSWNAIQENFGDYEEMFMLNLGSYYELYILDVLNGNEFNRNKYNLYNSFDRCCFQSFKFDLSSLQDAVNRTIERLGGDQDSDHFQIREFDNKEHSITDEMVAFIVEHASGPASKPAQAE